MTPGVGVGCGTRVIDYGESNSANTSVSSSRRKDVVGVRNSANALLTYCGFHGVVKFRRGIESRRLRWRLFGYDEDC
jgi:hypothetical protein